MIPTPDEIDWFTVLEFMPFVAPIVITLMVMLFVRSAIRGFITIEAPDDSAGATGGRAGPRDGPHPDRGRRTNSAERLRELKRLRDSNLISEAQYEEQQTRILNDL